jgi:hypothetical protein
MHGVDRYVRRYRDIPTRDGIGPMAADAVDDEVGEYPPNGRGAQGREAGGNGRGDGGGGIIGPIDGAEDGGRNRD